ncbi:hypothetical protein COY07_02465 [Candidatus Peregrinibacteria bacterium CG_4_10_14_0_2_um_filter_43_11]|nr:MAG: hypothetical protein COY07_02465 [Candidatus Peregrinibacteria bacterium CG_4_10_14_0_2_um_filter_43_11]
MAEQTVTCPKCGHEIPLSDALTEKMRHQLEGEIGKEFKEKERKLEERAKLLEESRKNVDAQVAKKLEAEKVKIQKEAEKKATEKVDIELQDLKKTNEDKEKQLSEMRKQELELRQKARDLETKEKNMDLEFNRKMDEATKVITAKAIQEAEEVSKMKLAEKDKKMDQMMKALEEANRKAEQGSMQVQGDAQETDLKLALQNAFISDSVEDVKTGIRGADLVQTVFSSMGQQQGVILWESKNQKAWQNEWIKKLKDDQGEKKADIAIIATQVLPEGIDAFGFRDGVWVTAYKYALPLAVALRYQLSEMSRVKQSFVGKDAKMEILYNYLGGVEFKNRIETIVMAFMSLKTGLDAEKRAMEKIWNRREKEIERVIKNTTGFYGDLEGIMGSAVLPKIKALELPSGEEDEEIEK